MHDGVAARLAPLLTRILLSGDDGPEPADAAAAAAAARDLPIRVRAWDGSSVGPDGVPTFVINHRRALRRMLWKPGEIGLVRAYVSGELDIEGDVFAALDAVQQVMRSGDEPIRLSSDDKREIVRTAVMLGAVGTEPKPPAEEFPTRAAERAADRPGVVAGPMGASADFFARLLGPAMTFACGRWDGAVDLDAAQHAAFETVTAELGLFTGARVLDLSCGWGGLALDIARRHSARVVAITASAEQAEHVRRAAARTGLADRVDPRVGDLTAAGGGPYDAIIGLNVMRQADLDLPRLYDLLAPGGTLLLQQMVRRPGPHRPRRTFTTNYMFPGEAELVPLGEMVTMIEEAGLEVRDIGALREHQARTLRAWAANLQRHWAECAELAGLGMARVWLLYLAASALACEAGRIGVHEIRAVRRDRDGRAGDTLVEDRAVLSR